MAGTNHLIIFSLDFFFVSFHFDKVKETRIDQNINEQIQQNLTSDLYLLFEFIFTKI